MGVESDEWSELPSGAATAVTFIRYKNISQQEEKKKKKTLFQINHICYKLLIYVHISKKPFQMMILTIIK